MGGRVEGCCEEVFVDGCCDEGFEVAGLGEVEAGAEGGVA